MCTTLTGGLGRLLLVSGSIDRCAEGTPTLCYHTTCLEDLPSRQWNTLHVLDAGNIIYEGLGEILPSWYFYLQIMKCYDIVLEAMCFLSRKLHINGLTCV